MSDKELLESISQKDANAFHLFYEKYSKVLLNKTQIRVKDIVIAEEIMQDFWINIWENPQKIKTNTEGDAKGFLSGFLFYRILDFLRQSSINAIVISSETTLNNIEKELTYTHVSEEYDIKELETVINSILEEMPNQMAEIFSLQYEKGYSLKEIATNLNLNERTVKYKSKQNIDTLKKRLIEEGIDISSFRVLRNATTSVVVILMADKIL